MRQDAVVTSWTTRFTSSRIAPGVFNFKWNLDEVRKQGAQNVN